MRKIGWINWRDKRWPKLSNYWKLSTKRKLKLGPRIRQKCKTPLIVRELFVYAFPGFEVRDSYSMKLIKNNKQLGNRGATLIVGLVCFTAASLIMGVACIRAEAQNRNRIMNDISRQRARKSLSALTTAQAIARLGQEVRRAGNLDAFFTTDPQTAVVVYGKGIVTDRYTWTKGDKMTSGSLFLVSETNPVITINRLAAANTFRVAVSYTLCETIVGDRTMPAPGNDMLGTNWNRPCPTGQAHLYTDSLVINALAI